MYRDEIKQLRIERDTLRAFRSRVLGAFARGHVSCDCAGICHDDGCPLGELEVEADAIWRASFDVVETCPEVEDNAIQQTTSAQG